MTKTPKKKRHYSAETLASLRVNAAKARAAAAAKKAAPESHAAHVAIHTEAIELDISLDAVMLRAIAANPAVLDFVTCWEVVQAGIVLPKCSMDEADAALRHAQQQFRDGITEPVKRVKSTKETTFVFAGDIGDIIAAMPVVRAMGGGRIVITPRPPGQFMGREDLAGARYEALRPLLAAQPYVTSVEWGEAPDNAVDFRKFRLGLPGGENLTISQARHVKCPDFSFDPWLTVTDPIAGPAVFARSPRYHQPRMCWHLIRENNPNAIFVGSPDEHAAFEKMLGSPIEYRPTKDFLELARLLAGCERLFCNASAPWWTAVGLGAPASLEVCPEPSIQNSIVDRANLHYVGNEDQRTRPNWH